MKRGSWWSARHALALVLLLTLAGPARAQLAPEVREGLYFPVGFNLGGAVYPGSDDSFVIGLEGSLVWLDSKHLLWGGGYLDALYDTSGKAFRFGLGAEIGFMPVGLEVGYLGQVADGTLRHGVRVGGVLTVSYIGLYGRYNHVFGNGVAEPDFAEVGVLLKFPVRVKVRPRPSPGPPPVPPPKPLVAWDGR